MTEMKTNELTYGMRLILWALSSGPKTTTEIKAVTKRSRSNISDLAGQLIDRGLVFVQERRRVRFVHAPVYGVHVKHPKPVKVGLSKTGRQNDRLQSILDAIKTHPMTAQEIADFTGSSRQNVNSCLTYTRDGGRNPRIVRVAEWQYQYGKGGGWVPAYGPGPRHDEPKPPTIDRAEYQRDWTRRNKAREMVKDASRNKNSVLAGNPFAQLIAAAGATRIAAGLARETA